MKEENGLMMCKIPGLWGGGLGNCPLPFVTLVTPALTNPSLSRSLVSFLAFFCHLLSFCYIPVFSNESFFFSFRFCVRFVANPISISLGPKGKNRFAFPGRVSRGSSSSTLRQRPRLAWWSVHLEPGRHQHGHQDIIRPTARHTAELFRPGLGGRYR